MDDFSGQRKIEHLEIPLKVLRDTDYLEWMRTTEASVYFCLYSYIVRSREVTSKIGKMMYYKYYTKNRLVASWSHKDIAIKIGLSENSKGYISKLLTSMVDKGMLIRHKDKLNRRSINIYEFGKHTGEPYKHEDYYLFEYFIRFNAKKKLAGFLGGNPPVSWGETGI
jgi:DNA-binding MarR family transcriptional regulator